MPKTVYLFLLVSSLTVLFRSSDCGRFFFSGPFSLKGLSFRPGSAGLMLLQTFLCKLLVLWPHLLLSVVLAVSGLGDGRGGMSTFFVYGLVVRGVCVCMFCSFPSGAWCTA